MDGGSVGGPVRVVLLALWLLGLGSPLSGRGVGLLLHVVVEQGGGVVLAVRQDGDELGGVGAAGGPLLEGRWGARVEARLVVVLQQEDTWLTI